MNSGTKQLVDSEIDKHRVKIHVFWGDWDRKGEICVQIGLYWFVKWGIISDYSSYNNNLL